MDILSVKEIGERALKDEKGFVAECEKAYYDKLEKIAQSLFEHTNDSPIILLSGPSGSGKTTTALRVEEFLDKMGVQTHTIAMDDYFHTCDKNEKAMGPNGVIDYESPYRVNIELLSEHLEKIANCEPVTLPHFNFETQQSTMSDKVLCRKKGELVILEGIHALNPLVTGSCAGYSSGIYISVRTRLMTDNGKVLHPSKIRLMRRLIRDRMYRARSLEESLSRYESVENGAEKYILPFKTNAQFQIDSFVGYEVNVYKDILYNEFLRMKNSYELYSRFADMEKVLEQSVALDESLVPHNSLIREFIG